MVNTLYAFAVLECPLSHFARELIKITHLVLWDDVCL